MEQFEQQDSCKSGRCLTGPRNNLYNGTRHFPTPTYLRGVVQPDQYHNTGLSGKGKEASVKKYIDSGVFADTIHDRVVVPI